METIWTLEDGLSLVRTLQPESRQFGYHICLGGGVINNGQSKKDLDLYCLPLNNMSTKPNARGILGWLKETLGGWELIGGLEYGDGESHYTWKVKFRNGGRCVDVFIIGDM